MKCPVCGRDTYVFDSRPNESHEIVRRRRICVSQEQHRFTTYEMPYRKGAK